MGVASFEIRQSSYLILSKSCQCVHCSDMPSSLPFVRKRIHDGIKRSFVFVGGWRTPHHTRFVRDEGRALHLSKVHRRVLARACEHHACQQLHKLISCLKTLGKLMMDISISDRKAIFMQVQYPGLQLVIL